MDQEAGARSRELELIRALAEDLAIEILASYTDEDFADADFSSLGLAAVYLSEQDALGPSFQELVVKLQTIKHVAQPRVNSSTGGAPQNVRGLGANRCLAGFN